MNFIDLQEQFRRYRPEIMAEIEEVLGSAQFIMGPAVGALEGMLAAHTGVRHAIGCASGTDALMLGLMALGVKAGDEIIVPDFTFFATAEIVAFLGATPVFVDISEETFNIDPLAIEKSITRRTRGIIPVSLFGQCAELEKVNAIAAANGLWVMEDAAQSYGALHWGKRSGSLTRIAATSFFPAKPLGCYGEGGAVFTNDDGIAATVRQLLNHGQSERYKHARLGINGRLDTLQAAILKVKLRHFEEEMAAKRRVADAYRAKLAGVVKVPTVLPHNVPVWAQFTARTDRREKVLDHLKSRGIPAAVHYPIPLHRQEAFSCLELPEGAFPVSCMVSQEVFSLPMHPFLTEADVDAVCSSIAEALR